MNDSIKRPTIIYSSQRFYFQIKSLTGTKSNKNRLILLVRRQMACFNQDKRIVFDVGIMRT